MTGSGAWAEAFGKARDLVGQMTLDEKVCTMCPITDAVPRLCLAGDDGDLTHSIVLAQPDCGRQVEHQLPWLSARHRAPGLPWHVFRRRG
jgi:hypothetical protein